MACVDELKIPDVYTDADMKNRTANIIFASVVTTVVVVGGLVGCSTADAPSGSTQPDGTVELNTDGTATGVYNERLMKLSDGREVVCVVYANGRQGGISCDWENAG